METFLQQYGWAGFWVYVLWKEFFPFVRDRVYPESVKRVKAERDRLKNLEERTIQNDERQTRAVETVGNAVHEMAIAITSNNERLSQLIVSHDTHARYMQDSLAAMRERSAIQDSLKRWKTDLL